MKAAEVLRRYANGDRDFRRVNLRGQNFRGKDLSGADFSEADIRGANFTNASLRRTNFTRSKSGLQPQDIIVSLWLLAIFSALLGFTTAVIFYLTTRFIVLDNVRYSFTFNGILLSVAFLLQSVYCILLLWRGKADIRWKVVITFCSVVAICSGLIFNHVNNTLANPLIWFTISLVSILLLSTAVCGSCIWCAELFASAVLCANIFAVVVPVLGVVFGIYTGVLSIANFGADATVNVVLVEASFIITLSSFLAWHELKKNKENIPVRGATEFAATFGTSFLGSDLN